MPDHATHDPRRGDWMQTASGAVFWPLDPRPGEILIEDIAASLSNLCRYLGHTTAFYSVAQHSVLLSRAMPTPELRLWGLLHDASEAYLVDVPRPVKPYLAGYAEMEARVMEAVCARFGMALPMPEAVKRADAAILADERAQLMAPCHRDWHLTEPPLGIEITPWQPSLAAARFLETFDAIQRELGR